MARISFNKSKLEALNPPAPRVDRAGKLVVAQADFFDETMPGFGLRLTSTNVRTWIFVTRLDGRLRRYKLGRYPIGKGALGLTLHQARQEAARHAEMVRRGEDPTASAAAAKQENAAMALQATLSAEKDLFRSVVAAYIDGYCKKETRRWKDTQRILNCYVMPTWGARPIHAITRLDVAELLDDVEENSGTTTANQVLATVRAMFNWKQGRDGSFNSPIVKRMARGMAPPRDRTLTEPEIRAVWHNLDEDVFGSIVRLLFLTLQRRNEVATMRWSDINEIAEGGPVWTISDDRYKTKVTQLVPLSPDALAIIKAQPKFQGCEFVFTTNGRTPFQGFGKKKTDLDKKLGGVPPWVLHDIRRTGRSLLAKLGISDDIAERVLGHLPTGVRRTYNRYNYFAEKKLALENLMLAMTSVTNKRDLGATWKKCVSQNFKQR